MAGTLPALPIVRQIPKASKAAARRPAGVIWPVTAGRITQTPYEPKTTHARVYAYDIAVPTGTPVRAAGRAGERLKVVQVRIDPKTFGRNVVMQSPGGVIVRESHLSSIGVTPGQTIQAGQIIGLSGGGKDDPLSGNSTGPHVDVTFYGKSKDLLAGYVGTPEISTSPAGAAFKPVKIPNAPRELSILSPSSQAIAPNSVQFASPATSVQLTGDGRLPKEPQPTPSASIVQWGSVGLPGGTKPKAGKQAIEEQATKASEPQGIKLFEYSLPLGAKGSFTVPTRQGGPQSGKDLVAIAFGVSITVIGLAMLGIKGITGYSKWTGDQLERAVGIAGKAKNVATGS